MLEILAVAVLGVGAFCARQLWTMNANLSTLCERVRDHGSRIVVLETRR